MHNPFNTCYLIPKIISDETFYTQSQIIVEKVPEFSAESLCLRQGMVTSGHYYLTVCVECFIRNYVSRVQKHSLPYLYYNYIL